MAVFPRSDEYFLAICSIFCKFSLVSPVLPHFSCFSTPDRSRSQEKQDAGFYFKTTAVERHSVLHDVFLLEDQSHGGNLKLAEKSISTCGCCHVYWDRHGLVMVLTPACGLDLLSTSQSLDLVSVS